MLHLTLQGYLLYLPVVVVVFGLYICLLLSICEMIHRLFV